MTQLQIASKVRQDLIEDLAVGRYQNLDKGVDLLNRINKLMLTNFSGSSEESSKEELRITRDVLEMGAFWSIAKKDIPSFERCISQLKYYYLELRNDLLESRYMYELIGLNFLFHLGQNRLDEFHAELELFTHTNDSILENDYIRSIVNLEQHFKDGDYSKISIVKHSITTEAYICLIDLMLEKNKPLLIHDAETDETPLKSHNQPTEESTSINEFMKEISTSTENKMSLNDLSQTACTSRGGETCSATDILLYTEQPTSNDEKLKTEVLAFIMNIPFQDEKNGSSLTFPNTKDATTGIEKAQVEDQSTSTEAFMIDVPSWTNDNPPETMDQSTLTDQWLRNAGTFIERPEQGHQFTSMDTFVKEISTSTHDDLPERINQRSLTDPWVHDAETSTEQPKETHTDDKCVSTDPLVKEISTSTDNNIPETADQSSSTHPWSYNETTTETPSDKTNDFVCPDLFIKRRSITSVKENLDEDSNTENCSPPSAKNIKKLPSVQPYMRLGLSRRIGKFRKPLHQLN